MVTHPWLDDARALRAGGRPITEIADLLGLHPSTAYRQLQTDDDNNSI